jgi:Ni/Co efflux regulator RcnB
MQAAPRSGPDQHVDQRRPGPPQNFDQPRPQNFDRGRPGPGGLGPGFRPRPGGFLDNHHWSFNQRFQGPSFNYPRGYGYQRWAFGAFLPGVFLAQNYTLYQYWTYGLPAPPPGYHWIRVGPDALLVRFGDGYVLDAVYGLFY